MGAFYSNVTVRGAVVDLPLVGLENVAVSEQDGWTVVVHEGLEGMQLAGGLAALLSQQAVALAVDVHDSDILQLAVFVDGELEGNYNSCPDYFTDKEEPTTPVGLPGSVLTAALGVGDAAVVEEILRFTFDWQTESERYVFEEERHADLVAALGLPSVAVGGSWGDSGFRVLT